MKHEMSAKFVVIGGGIAGVTCAETVVNHCNLLLSFLLSESE